MATLSTTIYLHRCLTHRGLTLHRSEVDLARSTLPLLASDTPTAVVRGPGAAIPALPPSSDPPPRRPAPAALQQLGRMTYVDAVLWIGVRCDAEIAAGREGPGATDAPGPVRCATTPAGAPRIMSC